MNKPIDNNGVSEIYFHDGQCNLIDCEAQKIFCVGARGCGKTHVLAARIQNTLGAMPGVSGALFTPFEKQTIEITLPALIKSWATTDFIEGIDFVYGKKPPPWFKKCKTKIKKFDNVLSVRNGCAMFILGTFNRRALLGGTDHFQFIDEAGSVKESTYYEYITGRLRGTEFDLPPKYRKTKYLRCLVAITSMPQTSEGEWIFNYKTLTEADKTGEEYAFLQWSVWDNEEVLTKKFIEKKRIEIGDEDVWQRDYENKRTNTKKDSYYFEFRADHHVYSNGAFNRDPFYKSNNPIYCYWDFNKKFRSCLIAQEYNDYETGGLAFQNEFFKEGVRLKIMTHDICDKYESHRNKTVYLGCDPSMTRGENRDNIPLIEDIYEVFVARGWRVIKHYKQNTGYPGKNHQERREFLNECLAENNPKLNKAQFRVNGVNCTNLVTSLLHTKIAIKAGKMVKDKRLEKQSNFKIRKGGSDIADVFDYMAHPFAKRFSGISLAELVF